jgi:succinate dehydrogenase / fumarate reductase, cytochrome b subunit
MGFFKSMVGRKIVMAVSGFTMMLFVVAHLLGNTSIFAGPNAINAYAMKLHELIALLWSYRVVMIIMLSLHFFYGIQLTLENNTARPQAYAVRKSLSATFAGKTMIWSGLILGAFLVYHLLQFTFEVTNPDISASRNLDPMRRPDVFHMVVLTFQKALISLIYVVAMMALAFHLTHGIQSFFQTLGLNNDRTLPVIRKSGTVAAVLVFLGFIAIPIIIYVGILKG